VKKHQDLLLKAEEHGLPNYDEFSINNQIVTDKHNVMDQDKYFISSNPKMSSFVYQGMCKSIPICGNLLSLNLIHQKLGRDTWEALGKALG
jgi:hypothetical protein